MTKRNGNGRNAAGLKPIDNPEVTYPADVLAIFSKLRQYGTQGELCIEDYKRGYSHSVKAYSAYSKRERLTMDLLDLEVSSAGKVFMGPREALGDEWESVKARWEAAAKRSRGNVFQRAAERKGGGA